MEPAKRTPYQGIVAAMPVTVPYQRFSIESAQWWLGRALRGLARGAGISHRDFDGFALASFTTAPDTAIGLTQHFGLSPRWLDHVPMGGVSGIISLRRAARAVQAGDASIGACGQHPDQDDKGRNTFQQGVDVTLMRPQTGGTQANHQGQNRRWRKGKQQFLAHFMDCRA